MKAYHPTYTIDTTPTVDPRPRRPSDEMSSPSKRHRTSKYSDLYPGPDETPTRSRPQLRQDSDEAVFDGPNTEITRSTSSFTAVLASKAGFSASAAAQQALIHTSHSPARSRSTSSPSKQFQKTASLLHLVRPVRFMKEYALRSILPDDAKKVFKALFAIKAKEEILLVTL